ncbi:MAG: hypothetical protein N2111_10625 [Candidatus Sumerlaeaceae bacterium]|nr:hypothetical protein [Candidatus Sumerlaeaceae bacterium]
MSKVVVLLACAVLAVASAATAGGELPAPPPRPLPRQPQPQPRTEAPSPKLERPQPGICRDWPMSVPRRRIGWGFNLNEFYGPTYYYPSEKLYEGNNPTYYPHYLPRLWPNYKAAPVYYFRDYGYASRSGHYWDTYDDWTRDARYGEHQ